mmetsp:Transcript_36896/g.90432  ORF Transcript_36896/g.90432 Transcript_36896/m.90432 type:complete len:279 (+) Transcript_36896:33-869(+)
MDAAPQWPQAVAVELQFVGYFFWLSKEIGWMLLVPVIAIPAGMAAVICICTAAFHRSRSPPERFLPLGMEAVWISANFVWMVAELLYDTPEQQTPWAMTPMLKPDEARYSRAVWVAQVGFVAVVVGWFATTGYCWVAYRGSASRVAYEAVVSAALSGSIAFWAMKDLFWSTGHLFPAVGCDVVAVVFLLSSGAHESGEGVAGLSRVDGIWTMWSLSNFTWILCELAFHGNLWWRFASAAIAAAALALLVTSYSAMQDRSEKQGVAVECDEDQQLVQRN